MQPHLTHFAAICMITISAVPATSAAQKSMANGQWSGTVSHVTDGDTLWVRPSSGGKPVRIRIDGVDAPEICQLYGPVSKKSLAARLANQAVTVESANRDNFGRLLARVHMQGPVLKGDTRRPNSRPSGPINARINVDASTDVGEWMVREGHAWSYRYRRDAGPYAKQQAAAQTARKGLFSIARPEEPRAFRKRHGICANSGDK